MSHRCPPRTHAPPDVSPSAGGTPGTESFKEHCGGDGCATGIEDTACRISDIVEDGAACSVNGSTPYYVDDGKGGSGKAASIFGCS